MPWQRPPPRKGDAACEGEALPVPLLAAKCAAWSGPSLGPPEDAETQSSTWNLSPARPRALRDTRAGEPERKPR